MKKKKTIYSGWDINNNQLSTLNNKFDVIICKIHNTDTDYLENYNLKILPVRNILDAAISAGIRFNNNSCNFYINHCKQNIYFYNKFKSKVDYIFRYDDYNVYYIKKLCNILDINLNNEDIIDIMIELENMLNSKDKVEKDDHNDKEYQKTLFSQQHNTSNGKTNKFINLSKKDLDLILKDKTIINFLTENFYF